MANEIVLPPGNDTALTVTAKVFDQSGSQVGSNVSCSEVGSTSIYKGNMPTASQAVYFVEFEDSSNNHLGTYEMDWTGSAERTVFDLATASALTTVSGKVDTVEGKVDTLDNVADSILVDTGTTIPNTLSTMDGKIDTVDTVADSILVDTGTTIPNAMATASALTTVENKIDTVDTNLDAVLVDTGTTIPNTLSAIDGKIDTVDTNVDSILVDTATTIPAQITGQNNISTSDVRTQVDSALTSYGPPTNTELTAAVTSIKGLGNRDNTEVYNASGSAGISAVQTAVDAIKVIVDKFNFNSANDVKSTLDGEEVTTNAVSRNASKADVALLSTINTAIAALNDISPTDVLTQATSAITTYDPPTKTEMDAFQTAITALINGLNNLSAAQVNNEVDTALADYDPPTKTEMDAGFAGLNDPTAAEIVTAMSAMVIEGSLTFVQYMRAIGAVLAGDGTVSVDGGTVTYKSPSGIKNVATATVNVSGNRDVTLDLT